jgi:small conductance mechanosensitive channel
MTDVLNIIYAYLAKHGLKVLGALVIFFVGRWLAGVVSRMVEKAFIKAKIDKTIAMFIKNLTCIGILVLVVIAALSVAGVPMGHATVVIGAAGLAVGLALQGSLANFAAGFLMLAFRPFKVGDFI